MAVRPAHALLVSLCALLPSATPALERPGDAAYGDALDRHARSVAALERETLALIAIAPDAERFLLYRTYDRLVGAWVQVDLLHARLDEAVALSAPDIALRNELADQAQFALWELDEADSDLERTSSAWQRPDHARIGGHIRARLREVRATVADMLASECARAD